MSRRKKKKHQKEQDFVLQITSLADIFTILLVFLIKAFSSGASGFTPQHDILLPVSSGAGKILETFKVEIAKDALIFENKILVVLKNFEFESNELELNGTPRAFNQALAEMYTKTDKRSDKKKLLVLADSNAPYKTLKRVFAAASANGFLDYQLVVAEDK